MLSKNEDQSVFIIHIHIFLFIYNKKICLFSSAKCFNVKYRTAFQVCKMGISNY
jgi:hypothetical protein